MRDAGETMLEMKDWDALDILYEAVHRLYHNQCDLTYIQGEVERAYQQIQWADEIRKKP